MNVVHTWTDIVWIVSVGTRVAKSGLVDLNNTTASVFKVQRFMTNQQRDLLASIAARLIVTYKRHCRIITVPVNIPFTGRGAKNWVKRRQSSVIGAFRENVATDDRGLTQRDP
jgi:hypothetical protein